MFILIFSRQHNGGETSFILD